MAFGVARILQLLGGGSLERVLEQISRGPVQVAVARCTHARHRLSQCKACAESCPFSAIRLPPDGEAQVAAVDAQACQGCGLCVPACPTQALYSDRWPMPEPGGQYRSIACAASDSNGAESTVPCLGAVEPIVWLASAEQPIMVYQGDCEKCALAPGAEMFRRRLDTARHLAAVWGADIRIVLRRTDGFLSGLQSVRDSEPTVSRREFFRLAGREARTDALAAVLPAPRSTAWQGERLPQARSMRRAALAAWLSRAEERLATMPTLPEDVPLWELRMAQACGGCEICTEMCPERALAWQQQEAAAATVGSGNSASLVFHATLCSGCRLCVETCPEQILVLEHATTRTGLGPKVLAQVQRRRCEMCSGWFKPESDETVCPMCDFGHAATVTVLLERTGDGMG